MTRDTEKFSLSVLSWLILQKRAFRLDKRNCPLYSGVNRAGLYKQMDMHMSCLRERSLCLFVSGTVAHSEALAVPVAFKSSNKNSGSYEFSS